jgi:hypothetical protein
MIPTGKEYFTIYCLLMLNKYLHKMKRYDIYMYIMKIVTCLLKARTVEQEETTTAREWAVKHCNSKEYVNATTEKLLEAVFSMISMPNLYTANQT